MNLQPYIDFTDYVLSKTSKQDNFYHVALELRHEIRHAIKNKRNLSWFWLRTAKELFDAFNIKDARINTDMIKDEIAFVYRRKKYTTKIFLTSDWQKYGKDARLIQNSSGMEDEKFVIETIKRYVDRGIKIDHTRAFLYYGYLVLFLVE